MKLARKPLAVCMATLFGVASFNAWGASPPPQDPTASQPDAAPPVQGVPETRPVSALLPAQPKEFPGIPWGSFLLFPDVSLAVTYDDNIYAERRELSDDVVYTLSPSLEMKSKWRLHELNLGVGGDFDRYRSHNTEDVDDYWLDVNGHYDLGARSHIFGGTRHSRDHEDRSTAGALNPAAQLEPTRYDHDEAHLGLAHAAGAFRLRIGGTWDEYDYKDGVSSLGVPVDNDFRDRELDSLGARVGYVVSPRYEVFGQYATDNRKYDRPIPGRTFNRDSDGYRAALGVKFTYPPQRVAGEAFAGVMRQEYDHSAFSDVSKPYYGAVLAWKPTSLVTATGFVDRSLEETTVFEGTDYASSALDTTVGFEIERRLSSRLSVSGRAAYTRSDFQSFDRLDKITDAGAGLRYYAWPMVYLGADLRVIDRDSDDLIAQYSRNQALVSIGYTPARNRDYSILPEREAGAPAAPRAQGLYSGFYLGAQAGYGGLTSTTSGVRGVGEGEGVGTDDANLGGLGASYGAFAGWGAEIDNWYLGVEVDAAGSDAEWAHRKDKPQAPDEFVEKDSGWGVSLRAGYVLDGGLLYGKLGAVETRFHSYFTENQFAATGAFDQKESETGIRFGVGLEIPASSSLFVRTDYSYARYDGYDGPHQTTAGSASERFDNRDDVFSVGLGWRFGSGRPEVATRDANELDGLYAGASAGHATLANELTGTHNDGGSTPGTFSFSGDFADSGFSGGFFAGYGRSWGQLYVGLEADAEASNFGWGHVRVAGQGGGGRDFAAEKRAGYGGSLRLGYVFGNGSLLYGRVGAVRTRFNTVYSKGAIDRSDRLDGVRFGLGAEIPASENAFVRMDYSYTHYDDPVDFVTPTNRVDDMRFEYRETLARLGLGFRF